MSIVIPLAARVQTSSGPGTVKFVGPTSFAAGKWVGVELDSQTGKNDGSVGGKRYFNCEEGRGVFVRDRMVTIIDSRVNYLSRSLSLFRFELEC